MIQSLSSARQTLAVIHRELSAPWLSVLQSHGYRLLRLAHADGLTESTPALLVGDPGGGICSALEIARSVRSEHPHLPVILVADESSEESAIEALRIGVNDYLKRPFLPGALLDSVARFLSRPAPRAVSSVVGSAPAMQAAVEYAERLAQTNSTVLITGETGTGKELFAELIHKGSARCGKPYIAINCAAIPDSLLESELFGRERGAYTGADSSYEGKLKIAEGGTVLFDEIGDLTPFGQAKLLRVLECRRAQRLGSAKEISLDIRIVAATNRDLAAMVESGQFRRDLYYRLNVTRLELPALRDHREDIPKLLTHFAESFASEAHHPFPGFTPGALRALTHFEWPGNVRQLRNVVEELFVRLPNRPVELSDLPPEITRGLPGLIRDPADEKSRIVTALTTTRWNKKRAAQFLKCSRMTLYRKMAMYQIDQIDASLSA